MGASGAKGTYPARKAPTAAATDLAKRVAARAAETRKAREALIERGAVIDARRDNGDKMRRGWWLDSVFLGPTSDPVRALLVVTG
jgi:hypothetical protein